MVFGPPPSGQQRRQNSTKLTCHPPFVHPHQLFNCPNTTLELVERNGLLDVVLGFLDDLLWRCCKAGEEVVDVRSAHLAEKVYGRTLGDIQMILEHRTTVVSHVLGRRFDLLEKILSSFSRLQGMNPYVRRTGDHVERENTDWVNGVMLESDMFLNMFDQICHGMGPAVANGVGEVTRNISLMGARAIAAATRWSEEGSGDPSLAYDRILAGEAVSVNLPLHRVCARVTQFFASAAALGASGLEGEALGQAKMQNLLSFVQENRESLARLVDPLLKAQAFMIQIRLGLWVRNGDEVVKLQVRGSFIGTLGRPPLSPLPQAALLTLPSSPSSLRSARTTPPCGSGTRSPGSWTTSCSNAGCRRKSRRRP